MSYLKHSNGNGKRAKAVKAKAEAVNVVLTGPDDFKALRTPSMQHDITVEVYNPQDRRVDPHVS
jgi:hypothetical protein